jgi:hypothetical protein
MQQEGQIVDWKILLGNDYELYASSCSVHGKERVATFIIKHKTVKKKIEKHIRAIVPIIDTCYVRWDKIKRNGVERPECSILISSTTTYSADAMSVEMLKEQIGADAVAMYFKGCLMHVSLLRQLIDCFMSDSNRALHKMFMSTHKRRCVRRTPEQKRKGNTTTAQEDMLQRPDELNLDFLFECDDLFNVPPAAEEEDVFANFVELWE